MVMKKLLVLLVLLGLGSMVMAQGVTIGLKGGINMASVTGADAGSPDKRTGLVGGVFANVDLMAINIQPEILFSQKGFKQKEGGQTLTGTYEYIDLPVLLKFPLGKIIVPSIYVGPSLGILLSSEWELAGESVSMDDYTERTDFGLVFGVDVKTPVKLSFDARYSMGLKTFSKEISGVTPELKNSVISFMVGISL
jgi:hypothetical protein